MRASLLAAFALVAAGCGASPPVPARAVPVPAAAPPGPGSVATKKVLFFGDSLTAGKGVAAAEAFPAVVGRLLAARGIPIEVVNAGVSGDTTAGGRRRLAWSLKAAPDFAFVALGGNDGLRGVSPAVTERNLAAILERLAAAGVPAAIAGMKLPRSLGAAHRAAFEALYPRLETRFGVPRLAFLLEGVALDPALNLRDRVHPNPAGHRVIAAAVADFLAPLLR